MGTEHEKIAGEFCAAWSRRNTEEPLDWEILHLASTGPLVFTERVDPFVIGDHRVAPPVAGVFEIRDGRIAPWRNYFRHAVSEQANVLITCSGMTTIFGSCLSNASPSSTTRSAFRCSCEQPPPG